jgi:4-hydroxy-tetrahydrodipicolinate synthase
VSPRRDGAVDLGAPQRAAMDRPALRLEGVFSVLPTVFRDDGSLDLEGQSALVGAHIEAGVAGLTVLGVMGEAGELSDVERTEVMATVLDRRIPVVAGVSGPSSDVVARRSQEAARAGVSAVMVSPSSGLDLAAAVGAARSGGVPIVIQDYPAGSGVELSVADIGAVVAAEPLVVGVKAEAPPTSGTIASLHRSHPDLALVGGLGGLFLIDELRAGARGVMTGFALPERLVAIVAAFSSRPDDAEREWLELLPLMRFEAFQPFSLAARKEVWRLRGVIASSHCRRRGAVLDDRARADVRRALESVTAQPVPSR